MKKGTYQSKKTSKRFFGLVGISFFQLIFDMWSVYTVNHLETVSELTNRIIHNLYMGLMLILFYYSYKYLEIVIEEEIGDRIKKNILADIYVTLGSLGIIFLPLNYIETPQGNYSFGPAAFTIYIGVAFYLLLIIWNLIKYWEDIPNKKRLAMFIVIISEVVVGIYQIFVPTALISCLAIVLLNLGIYLTTENPDAILVEMLEKETKRADIANQAKTDFLARMSHEIRTPIHAILGMNEMILRETEDDDIREYAKDVENAANSLLSIINDILDITKIEAGKITIIPVEYDFFNMLNDIFNMIQFRAEEKSLEFKMDIDETIPNIMMGDDIRIRQVLINLLNNAIKYTFNGKVSLKISKVLCEEDDMVALLFEVKDTGIGIKEEDIEKLYVPFQRIEEERNRKIEGTGSGMNISMQLLALMDSSLIVESVYGEGSTFSFVLKQKIIDERPIENIETRIREQDKKYVDKGDFQAPNATVLVVDDNAVNRKVMKSLLKKTKICVDVAEDGYTCLEMIKKKHYDIIFLDHMMLGLDGIQTLHRMKQMNDSMCKEVPVIALTANAVVGAKEMYLKEGFDAFLSKPISIDKLEKLIFALLPKHLVVSAEATEEIEQLRDIESDVTQKIEGLPDVEGIDWKQALLYLRDEKLLKETARNFYYANETEAIHLEECYDALEKDENAMNEYRIRVHGMKGLAALIAANELRDKAKKLEFAARDEDIDTIRSLTEEFLTDWRSYREKLSVLVTDEQTQEEKKNIADVSNVLALLTKLCDASAYMNIDMMDATIDELKSYQYTETVQKLIDELHTAVINLDNSTITIIVEKIMKHLEKTEE